MSQALTNPSSHHSLQVSLAPRYLLSWNKPRLHRNGKCVLFRGAPLMFLMPLGHSTSVLTWDSWHSVLPSFPEESKTLPCGTLPLRRSRNSACPSGLDFPCLLRSREYKKGPALPPGGAEVKEGSILRYSPNDPKPWFLSPGRQPFPGSHCTPPGGSLFQTPPSPGSMRAPGPAGSLRALW